MTDYGTYISDGDGAQTRAEIEKRYGTGGFLFDHLAEMIYDEISRQGCFAASGVERTRNDRPLEAVVIDGDLDLVRLARVMQHATAHHLAMAIRGLDLANPYTTGTPESIAHWIDTRYAS